ncbi:MAG: hypothetical protein AAB551_02010 [Patescibacteria group bacterium]
MPPKEIKEEVATTGHDNDLDDGILDRYEGDLSRETVRLFKKHNFKKGEIVQVTEGCFGVIDNFRGTVKFPPGIEMNERDYRKSVDPGDWKREFFADVIRMPDTGSGTTGISLQQLIQMNPEGSKKMSLKESLAAHIEAIRAKLGEML